MFSFFKRKPAAPRPHQDRSPRLRFFLGDEITLNAAGQTYGVANISETGLGLRTGDLHAGTRLKGSLRIRQKGYPVEIEIVRQNGGEAGGRFFGGSEGIGSELRKLFSDELQALQMSEVSGNHLQADGAGKPHWFYAPGNFELYFVEANGQILQAQASWNDRLVAAKRGEKARAGRTSDEGREKPGHNKSSLIEWQATLTDEDRYKALRIVENIRGLDPWKEQLITLFRN